MSRCVYIAPLEALARQRYADWEARFGQAGLGLKISLFTVRHSEGLWAECTCFLKFCMIASKEWLWMESLTLQHAA